MKLAIIYGTRPELIKLAPVYLEAKNRENYNPLLISSGQHKSLLEQGEGVFSIKPDVSLDVMAENQSLSSVTSNIIDSLAVWLKEESPDYVIVQGDTTTAFASALVASYLQIPVGHVEAGLRTFDNNNPFPEEMNRVLISRIATHHFAPTLQSKNNLLAEGIKATNIVMTGNTIVDAIEKFKVELGLTPKTDVTKTILVTMHRRENFGEPIANVCKAVASLSKKRTDVEIIFPVHPNPNVRSVVFEALSNIPNVSLIEPLDYKALLKQMASSSLIITDSGGIQEEAPSFGIPVLICRETTERPEIIDAGLGHLVGHDSKSIVDLSCSILDGKKKLELPKNPFGDGNASAKILDFVEKYHELKSKT